MAVALATVYRPKTFDDVVGQEHVVTILRNQIAANNIKQGYLFTGGAGTGKTTNARIFAREINEHRGEPIEIDAASNNGVDNIRELRETCKFKPLDSKYKVYIIDEVHMLSTGAWNALLKTLEEPPAHAVFIMCTTDPHKIPATILSRVQRFDFKRMTLEQTVSRLQHIVNSEEVQVSPEALEYLSKLANGGMRDAISLLDTCLSYKSPLNLSDVFEILGVPDYREYLNVVYSIIQGDHKMIIETVESLHIRGRDLKRFVGGLAEFVIDLRKLDLLKDTSYISAPSIYYEDINNLLKTAQGKSFNLTGLFKSLSGLSNRIKYENQPKTLVEGELISL